MKPDFETYHRPETAARYSWIPIDRLEEFRAYQKRMGLKRMYTMFRGPRRKERTWYGRIGQSMCLKKDATHFSVYWRDYQDKPWNTTTKPY